MHLKTWLWATNRGIQLHRGTCDGVSESVLRAAIRRHLGQPPALKQALWKHALHSVHLLHLEIWNAKSRSALWQNSQINPFAWQSSQPSTWEVELFRISLRRGSNCPRLIFTRSSSEKRCSSSVRWLGTRSNSFSTLQRKPKKSTLSYKRCLSSTF